MSTFEINKSGISKLNVDINQTINLLEAAPTGTVVSYEMLSQHIGRDIRKAPYILSRARAKLRDEQNILFDTVSGRGLLRMDNSAIAGKVSSEPFHRIQRTVENTRKDMKCINHALLTNGEKTKVNAAASILGAIGLAVKKSVFSGIAQSTASGELAVSKTLEFFKGEAEKN